jgi:hypothetical protein
MKRNNLPTDAVDPLSVIAQRRVLKELPPPVAWCNYKGDQSHSIGTPMGPNLDGEWMTMVSCDYDPDTGKSHAGFAYGYIIVDPDHEELNDGE